MSSLALAPSASPRARPKAVPALAGVWQADALHAGAVAVVASGHAALDAELPGGGWPLGALIELLLAQPTAPLWSLLLPALVAHQRAHGGAVALVNPPHEPFLPALAAGGLATRALLWVRAGTPAAQLWASEQALRCADVAAVLAWLPQARMADLRRLHLAAALRPEALLLALRPEGAGAAASPAPLRLRLWGEAAQASPALRVELVKRRGPPLPRPLWLPAQTPPLRALLAVGVGQPDPACAPPGAAAAGAQVLPFDRAFDSALDPAFDSAFDRTCKHACDRPAGQDARHALDRLAVAA